MSDAKTVLQLIKDKGIKYVSLRFTDFKGKWQHLSLDESCVDEDLFTDGTMFDGSSIAGWKPINESDMILMPDPATAVIDPFVAQPTLVVFCDIVEPATGEGYTRDPRSVAKRAEAYVSYTGLGDTVYIGPEAEFFVFDDVKFKVAMNKVSYEIDDIEGPYNTDKSYESGNLGYRPAVKGGYFPVQPVDSLNDMRGEMLSIMGDMGLPIEKHHHEVAASQHELGIKFATLVRAADYIQIYKYVVQNVAYQYGKSATFMPKPIKGDNGSGMHVHQSIWKDGKTTFAGDKYAGLSDACLYYIGGIIKHAKAINAFTNPTTNSYKRLMPGFEAPVLLAYSSPQPLGLVPHSVRQQAEKAKRVEVRFPDPLANPYLAFSAMLMAGIDGILNKIHPGEAMDKDLYHLPPEELKHIPTVCGSLREALENLDKDREFLTKGGVFTDDLIDSYIALKYEEVYNYEHTPHPVEFDMYYSN